MNDRHIGISPALAAGSAPGDLEHLGFRGGERRDPPAMLDSPARNAHNRPSRGQSKKRWGLNGRWVACVLGALLAVPAAGNGPNLLANGDFDSSLSGWTGAGAPTNQWSATDRTGFPGSGSLYHRNTLTNPNNYFVPLSTCVPAAPGAYVGSVWAMTVGSAGDRVQMQVGFYATADCSGTALSALTTPTATAATWRQISALAVAPAGTIRAKVYLQVIRGSSPSGVQQAWLDDVFVGLGKCNPGATKLCLEDDRFAVTAAWKTADGATGVAGAIPFSPESGAFWFFGEGNVEVFVKVLDACALNGRFWVFSAGATSVEVTLTVTDTQTGAVKTYTNPQGRIYRTVTDTNAFACP